jgi:hypothetical protein
MTASTSKTHVFSGVTLDALKGLRGQAGGKNYSLELDPDGVGGLFTMRAGMSDVVVRFSHNNERSELTLTIVKKPMLLPAAMIWAGTSQVLRLAADQASASAAKPKSVGVD